MKEKIALVTGGSGNIGRAISLVLAKQGCHIVLTENTTPCKEAAAEIENLGKEALVIRADVSDVSETEKVIAQIQERFGGLDVLVNCAGINPFTPVLEIEEAEWDRVMAVNLKSYFFYAVHAFKLMKESGKGRIVNISSQNGKDGGTLSGTHYAATKAAINVLTVRLAREFAPYGVTVNAVAPGPIASAMTEQYDPEVYKAFLTKIPLGREGFPEDVAAAVAFLASDSASWITGEILDVNGGMYMD